MTGDTTGNLGTARGRDGRARFGIVVLLWLVAAAVCPLLGGVDAVGSGEPWWHAVLSAVLMIVPATVGAALALRLPSNLFGYLLLASTAVLAAGNVANHWATHHPEAPGAVWAAWVGAVSWAGGPPALPLLALLFPTGRAVGRCGRWGVRAAVTGMALVAAVSALLPGRLAGLSENPGPINPLGIAVLQAVQPALLASALGLLLAATVLAVVTLGRRWRHSANERLALATVGTPLMVAMALAAVSSVTGVGGHELAVGAVLAATLGVPAGIWVAVTHYRLYDLDLAIVRTLAYAVLAGALAGLFALTAVAAGLVVGRGSSAAAAVAAAVTALASAPARERVLTTVQRAVLGVVGDPQRAASIIESRLAAISDPDLLADAAERVVGDVLGLAGLRVIARGRDSEVALAVTVPLRHHDVDVGVLGMSGPVTASARVALARVAAPVAAALHAASLSEAVRRSRFDLLAAVQEERRRLRRDLHDGLGPRLATLAMGLDAASNRLTQPAGKNAAAATALGRLRRQADDMLDDLRAIISGLRPAALDEFGLVGALRLHAAEVSQSCGLDIELVAEDLGPLGAAVEVAAYRIAAEAVLNAARHSHGRRCTLTVARDNGVALTVTDDGSGIPEGWAAGVGTQSMRERAATIGGWVSIGPAPGAGTTVCAWLPTAPA